MPSSEAVRRASARHKPRGLKFPYTVELLRKRYARTARRPLHQARQDRRTSRKTNPGCGGWDMRMVSLLSDSSGNRSKMASSPRPEGRSPASADADRPIALQGPFQRAAPAARRTRVPSFSPYRGRRVEGEACQHALPESQVSNPVTGKKHSRARCRELLIEK